MSAPERPSISVHNVTGSNVNIGDHNSIVAITSNTPANAAELEQQLEELRSRIKAEAPAGKQTMALGLVDELASASKAPRDNEGTLNFVRSWFLRNLPGLAGAVSSIVLGPIGGKLVEAVGDGLAGEVERRFDSNTSGASQ